MVNLRREELYHRRTEYSQPKEHEVEAAEKFLTILLLCYHRSNAPIMLVAL
jgi:hypothetical protein